MLKCGDLAKGTALSNNQFCTFHVASLIRNSAFQATEQHHPMWRLPILNVLLVMQPKIKLQ